MIPIKDEPSYSTNVMVFFYVSIWPAMDAQTKHFRVCLWGCFVLRLAYVSMWHFSRWPMAMWTSSHQLRSWIEQKVRKRKQESAPFFFLPHILNWDISSFPTIRRGLIPVGSLVLRLRTWTELHHWLFLVFSLQKADCGTSKPPKSPKSIPHNKPPCVCVHSISLQNPNKRDM